eukprot:TRINITY_DN12767_c0_g1_i1.p1 TRINITY_DN12767_c0_g1~~TRINITY_DN12767_c0_g1_i1.p1  ORF type:complete len:148 (+),score=35.32 TRINITY_DN12767_c0_g1_i1:195-638(+)
MHKAYLLFLLAFVLAVAGECNCGVDECGCCELIDVPKIGIHDTGCLNITYVPSTVSLSLTFWLDGNLLFNETVSAEDPDICIPVPVVKDFVDVCVDFTKVAISSKGISGCVAAAFELLDITVASFNLGCFFLPDPFGAALKTIGLQL